MTLLSIPLVSKAGARQPRQLNPDELQMDRQTYRDLEVFETQGSAPTLFDLLNRTRTAGGAKVLALPKSVMDLAFKESMALYSELSASNPNWKKIYTDYSNFRRDQNLWFRFTEAQFDRYMQSAKL